MKYAIIADVHANLEALQAVLQDMKAQGCTHTACLGDIVGYGANPKECLDIIRSMNIPCVRGNFDEYCSSDTSLEAFSPNVVAGVTWTRLQLSDDQQKWLQNLKLVEVVDGFTIVHATLSRPSGWEYVFTDLGAAMHFPSQKTPVCFFGHTNVPITFVRDTMVRGGTYSKFKVEAGKRYFINPGSVGQPRDGNPKAAYVTYDMDDAIIQLRRVDYDIPGAQGKMDAAGLPKRPQ